MTAPVPSPCRAILTPASPGEYGVRFVLSNPTSHAISIDGYEPFLQFHVRATVNGTALAIEQPTLDIPLHPITRSIPASGTLDLATPVRLRFGGDPSRDGFVWSIAHAPTGVELTFSLDLPAPFDRPFMTRL